MPKCKGVICIENNKPKAIEIMKKAVQGHSNMSVAVVKTKYPEGAERCLINAITGRYVNSKMLPADAGCVVDNVGTVMAVYDAVKLGKPLYDRVFTLSGDAVKQPGNFLVPVGMSYQEIVDQAGGFKQQPEKLISGGPMMGFALFDLNVPVTKTSGAMSRLS
jgi:electron transport complex protein RnfC